MIFRFILLLAAISFTMESMASVTINERVFKKGSFWTWSYSELDEEGLWEEPYLYETYLVVDRAGDLVTIEMFSSSNLRTKTSAHHKFKANIKKCLKKGANARTLKRWGISFYTKSLGPKWELLSHNFKNLAFTEKFNCFSGDEGLIDKEFLFYENTVSAFQWVSKELPKSWYLTDGHESAGVAFIRFPGQFKMELVKYHIN